MIHYDDDYYYEFSKKSNLRKNNLIFPLFVDESNKFQELNVMPGIFKVPYNKIIQTLEEVVESGVHSIILFGIPRLRNTMGTAANSKNGIVQKISQVDKIKFWKQNFDYY